MTYVETHEVVVTTDASGDATAYIGPINGRLANLIYTKDDFANGVDFTITAEDTALGIWTEADVNATKTVAPLQPAHNQSGVEQDTAGDVWEAPIYLADERIKIVIANGGNATSGTFTAVIA